MSTNQSRFSKLTERLTTLGLMGAILLAVSGCGAQGELEPAPPIFDESGKPIVREMERALPDPNGKSRMKNPYAKPVPVSSQPLEGTGNAQRH